MKLSIAAITLAAMAGSASAGIEFEPAIPFTQFDGDCSGEVLYSGQVVSIEELEYGSFCVAENIDTEAGSMVSYSRVDIASCTEDKIYENWHSCDEGCATCDGAYSAYTTWDSVNPDPVVGHCYDYVFSLDTVKTTRKIATFDSTRQINFSFDADANPDDVKMYVEMMDLGSCIADGPPVTADEPVEEMKDDMKDDMTKEDTMEEEEVESGASTLAATAAVAMGAVVTLLLA